MVEYCARRMPRWHPISISGYHIREAGSTAQQELAFTLKDGFTYVEQALERGLDVDEFAPRLSFFFNAHIDFFEEIAKYRAARRIWARELRDTYGAQRRALAADALPHPDRGRVADRPAAAQQHRAHGHRGAVGGAGRHPVAAHQLLRRGARAADRGGGADGAAHPADHRPRDRRDQHDRPARRLLLRGGADRPHGGGRLRATSPRSTSSAAWSRRSSRTTRSARSPTRRFRLQEEIERGERIDRRASTATEHAGRARARDPAHPARARAQADRPRAGRARRAATARPSRPRWASCARRPRPTAT